jgi:Fic family protein
LCADFHYWDQPGAAMSVVEAAARLQNRLTKIHPFTNGNGRHARLITDIFFYSRGLALPQWPQLQRMAQGDRIRQSYIAAMRSADQDDFAPLAAFIQQCLEGN